VVPPAQIRLGSPSRGQDVVADRCPLQGMADDVCDVVLRSPVPRANRAIDAGVVAGPPSGLLCLDRAVRDAVENIDEFPHRCQG
jgi:hypothetical protein